jgi:hypothetical protein
VVGAVGWANARLPLPPSLAPVIAALIERTWAEPGDRPSFSEVIDFLKPLQHASLGALPAAPGSARPGSGGPAAGQAAAAAAPLGAMYAAIHP